MASFVTTAGTGTFEVQTGDGMIPRFGRTINYSLEHIPFSDTDVLDYGGKSAPIMKATIIVLAAAVASMEACLGLSGSLITPTITTTARLIELSNPRHNFDGTHYFYDATWIQTL